MQIYDILKKDHDKVRKLLSSIEEKMDRELFAELKKEVTLHSDAEEETFYEPLQEKAGKSKIVVKNAHTEHELVTKIMKQLDKIDEEEEWLQLFAVMKKSLEAHIKMEEEDMFALAKKLFTSVEATEMASDMKEKKDKLNNKYKD